MQTATIITLTVIKVQINDGSYELLPIQGPLTGFSMICL